jgi:uncharacterized protein (DUF2249 family)/iron-sulfur cluster repair protein YtfE (RIC family)
VTITGTEAYEAMLAHHRMLDEQLGTYATAVSGAVAVGYPHEAAVAGLVAYLAEEVLPHAAAEEETLYPAAAHGNLTRTISEMIGEHRVLSAAAERLAGASRGAAAAAQARHIADLFSAHVAKENDILLPALLAERDADLAVLLAEMHRHTEEAGEAAPVPADQAIDLPAAVMALLLEAAAVLARAGHADRACRIAASAWAAAREPRPDLAVTVTAALHGLAHSANDDPTRAEAAEGDRGPIRAEPADGERGPIRAEPADGERGPIRAEPAGGDGGPGTKSGSPAPGPDLDVRDLPPARRHEAIFATYQALAPGAGFVLVNDHDPKPLRYQFEAEHRGEFTWDYLESGPEAWRVRIGRAAA